MRRPEVDLSSPDSFAEGAPHELFRRLRREAPVSFHLEPSGPGFWVLAKHADVKWASRNPEIFSSARGGTNIPDLDPAALAQVRALMLNMDPPEHRRFRNLVNKAFTPRVIQSLRPRVERMARRIVNRVCERGACDFVNDVASHLPMEVICEMMGVPEEDRQAIYDLTNRLIGFDDPEFQTSPEDGKLAAIEMFVYAARMADRARRSPGDDLTTHLLAAEVDGHRLSELEFNSFFMLLCVAGNETTRTVTTHGIHTLIRHRDQMRRVQQDLALLESAVEEILRYEPAVHYFRRTATRDVDVRGQRIREGDKVTMWYPSANRDEEVFADPDRFDVSRAPNDHLAFGVGEHFCLGSHLARMELRVIFREVLTRLPDIELDGPVRRLRSNFVNGVKALPVVFTPSEPLPTDA